MANVLTQIGESLTGIGAISDLVGSIFGSNKRSQSDELAERERVLREFISLYGLSGYREQYIDPSVVRGFVNDTTSSRFTEDLGGYFQAVANVLNNQNAHLDNPKVSMWSVRAKVYINQIDAMLKNSNQYTGLNTDLTTGKTGITYNAPALKNNASIAGFPSWVIIALILGVGATYIYSKK